jgi:hypothetical protein
VKINRSAATVKPENYLLLYLPCRNCSHELVLPGAQDFFMAKKVIIVVIILVLIIGGYELFKTPAQNSSQSTTPTSALKTTTANDTFMYQGAAGKDALTLLKAKTSIVQDKSGLVVSINGRKADNSRHEFWEFIVNGKEAEVGPAQYQTKNTDKIEWKIAMY